MTEEEYLARKRLEQTLGIGIEVIPQTEATFIQDNTPVPDDVKNEILRSLGSTLVEPTTTNEILDIFKQQAEQFAKDYGIPVSIPGKKG